MKKLKWTKLLILTHYLELIMLHKSPLTEKSQLPTPEAGTLGTETVLAIHLLTLNDKIHCQLVFAVILSSVHRQRLDFSEYIDCEITRNGFI